MTLRTKNEWISDAHQSARINTIEKPSQHLYNERAVAELGLLRQKLTDEGEMVLLAKIAICQKPLVLKCLTCNARKQVAQRCKKRWCPCCAKALAGTRARELDFIVARMRWPLFVTLTMRHDSTPSCAEIRQLIRAFGKFRRRKLWTCRTRGGVAAVEITSEAGSWHPHLHAVIDCQWLALKTPPPRPRDAKLELQAKFLAAATELSSVWAKQLGQPTASVRVKRANRLTIAKEVVKYTVKNEDLVMCKDSAGDIIRAIEKTRAFKTFGEAHGSKVKDIRSMAKAAARAELADWREAQSLTDCCPAVDLMPEALADNFDRMDKMQHDRVIRCEADTRRSAIAAACRAGG